MGSPVLRRGSRQILLWGRPASTGLGARLLLVSSEQAAVRRSGGAPAGVSAPPGRLAGYRAGQGVSAAVAGMHS